MNPSDAEGCISRDGCPCDVPDGMTLRDWRNAHTPRKRHPIRRLRSMLRNLT